MEEGDLFSGDVGKIDEGRIERFDFAAGEIFHKTAKSDEMIGLSNGLQIIVSVFRTIAVELKAVLAENFAVDFDGFNIVFV